MSRGGTLPDPESTTKPVFKSCSWSERISHVGPHGLAWNGLILLASAQLLNLIKLLASVLRDVVILLPLNMAITDRISIMSSAEMAAGRLWRCPKVVCGRPLFQSSTDSLRFTVACGHRGKLGWIRVLCALARFRPPFRSAPRPWSRGSSVYMGLLTSMTFHSTHF